MSREQLIIALFFMSDIACLMIGWCLCGLWNARRKPTALVSVKKNESGEFDWANVTSVTVDYNDNPVFHLLTVMDQKELDFLRRNASNN